MAFESLYSKHFIPGYFRNFILSKKISIIAFLPVESNSEVHFRRPELENLYNPEKRKFMDYQRLLDSQDKKLTLDLDYTGQKTLISIS